MRKFLGYIFSPIFLLVFGFMLLLFHAIQVISLKMIGDNARKRSVDIWNWLILKSFVFVGSCPKFVGLEKIPKNRPLIIVANHQSTYDIPPIIWAFRASYPKFISKIELAKGIPSISYNLVKGGSALIDRSNKLQAIKTITQLGRTIEKNNFSAVIYPEGTRSKDGNVGEFQSGGIHSLLRAAPSAIIVPFAISGHSKLQQYGSFPLSFGEKISYHILDPIEPKGANIEELVSTIRNNIIETLEQLKTI